MVAIRLIIITRRVYYFIIQLQLYIQLCSTRLLGCSKDYGDRENLTVLLTIPIMIGNSMILIIALSSFSLTKLTAQVSFSD